MSEERTEGRDEAESQMVQETEAMVRSLERAAETTGAPPPTEAAGAAVVTALGKVAEQVTAVGAYVQQTNQLIQSNLNEFSKSLANTDISAQRAAEAAQATAEALQPEEEVAPDAGENPSDVSELPAAELEQNKSKAWWFGKAAYRHGKARP